MTKTELQAAIYAAFDEVPYPGDENLVDLSRELPSCWDDDYGAEDFCRMLKGRDWRSLHLDNTWEDALYFMTDAAFHYYFPAFLVAAIEPEDNSLSIYRVVLHDITPSALQGSAASLDNSDFEARFTLFTPAQKQCIRDFIQFRLTQPLVDYWPRWIIGSGRYGLKLELLQLLDYWKRFSSAA